MIQNRKYEKKVNDNIYEIANCDSNNILNCNLKYIQINENIKLEYIKSEYDNSIKRIDKFEDKAKNNLVAISISVTVMLGLITPINQIYTKYDNILIKIIGIIMCLAVVCFMIYAAILSLKVLMEKNIVYKVSIADLNNSDDCMKKIYGQNVELNEMNNTIRNNYINTSFKCIRNALILLAVIFMIGIIPIDNNKQTEIESKIERIEESINQINKKITELEVNRNNSNELINNQEENIEKLKEDVAILKYKIGGLENKKEIKGK